MELNNMTKEELETLSYTDLAEMILKEKKLFKYTNNFKKS